MKLKPSEQTNELQLIQKWLIFCCREAFLKVLTYQMETLMSSTQELPRRIHVNDHRDANDSTAGDNLASGFTWKPLVVSTQALGEWVWCWPGEEEVGT